MNARPNAWLTQAENDLALAHLACDNGYLAQACFIASQAAEKALKSALLELGQEPNLTTPTCLLISQRPLLPLAWIWRRWIACRCAA